MKEPDYSDMQKYVKEQVIQERIKAFNRGLKVLGTASGVSVENKESLEGKMNCSCRGQQPKQIIFNGYGTSLLEKIYPLIMRMEYLRKWHRNIYGIYDWRAGL